MARLSISLLGDFQVSLDGELVTNFAYDKVRALLAYLAVESDRPRRREILAGLLWPDWPERSARQSLSQALYSLRGAIGDRQADPPFLLAGRDTVQFNRECDLELDAMQFEFLAAEESPQGWEEALALYRGPFLEGFSLPDSAPFEEWARLQRERLTRLTLEGLGKLASHWESEGDVQRALGFAERRVALASWDETGHRQIMRLLALSGRRSAALAQYEACCRALVEELDAQPSAETVALHDRIRAGELAAGKEHRTAAPPPHNLPATLTPTIGRERELAEIWERLADEGHVERAVEVYAVASTQPLVGNSVWFEDVAGNKIAAAAEGLPPQVVADARERGRARDMWATAEELLAESYSGVL